MGTEDDHEENLLRSVALQNAQSILAARQRAEEELTSAKEALERGTDELAQSVAMLRATLESTTDGILVTDRNGTVTDFNQKYVEMWRIPAETARGATHLDLVKILESKFLDPRQYRSKLEGIYASSPNETFDVLELADGRIFERFSSIQHVGERNVGRVWSFRDTTQRRKAEAALRQTEERFRASFHQAAVGMVVAGLDGKLAEVNERFSEIVDYPLGELYERNLLELTHPDDLPRTLTEIRRLLSGEITDYAMEKRYVRKDGSPVWCLATATLIKNEFNEPQCFIVVIEDITSRKKTEEALQARERERSLIFNNISDGIFHLRVEGPDRFRFLSVNPAFLTATGFSKSEVVGKCVHEVIPGSSYLSFAQHYRAAIKEQKTARWEETVAYPSGKKTGAMSITPIFDADQNCVNLIGTLHDVTERNRWEEDRLRLAAVVESSDDAILSKTLEGIISSWNKGAERMFGYTAEEIVGKPIIQLIPPDYQDEEPKILAKLRRGERIDHYETIRVRKDGTLLNISVTVSPVRDASGKIVGASKIARDITERKQVEESLRRSEARFRQLADAMPQIVWSADVDGRFDYYNRRWYESIGASAETATWSSLLHPDDSQRFFDLWRQSIKTGEPFQAEYRFKSAQEGYRWHLGRALAVRNEEGEIVRWYGSSTDIQGQKATAEALQEEYSITEQLHEVAKALATELDLGKVVQIITDAGTRVTRAQFGAFFYNVLDENGASYMLYTLSGVPREMFEKFPMPRATEIFGPTFRGEGVIRIDDVRKDRRFGKNAPYHGMPPGHLPVVSYLAVPVFSRSGEVLGGLFFGHPEPGVFTQRDEKVILGIAAQASAAMEIARIYQAEQQARTIAEQANQAKDHFIAALSHELRTPLTPALAILSDLGQEYQLPEALAEELETVRRNVELEARLIDDLLDLTRITSGKLELRKSRVTVNRIIEDAINTCLVDLEAKQLSLVRDFEEPSPLILADSARITQILWNLLKNAIKFTPAGGTITVSSNLMPADEAGQAAVVVKVRDTGIGIEPAQLGRVFDAFEQGGRNITRQFGGLGLGLAISKAIANTHKGSLTASSDGSGLGSTFTLTLPVSSHDGSEPAPVDEPPAKAGETVPPGAGQRPIRILLVEDHGDTAATLMRLLRRMGHEVLHAGSVAAALELAELADAQTSDAPIDLVISDMGLPDGTGLELMRELSNRYRLPGIALSGFGMDSDVRQSIEAGFSSHLTKPIDIAVLLSTLENVVRSDRRRDP